MRTDKFCPICGRRVSKGVTSPYRCVCCDVQLYESDVYPKMCMRQVRVVRRLALRWEMGNMISKLTEKGLRTLFPVKIKSKI